MNLYRGCLHDCVYCIGRAEKYRVEGEFGKEVEGVIHEILETGRSSLYSRLSGLEEG